MGRPLSIETGALYSDACPSKHLPFSVPTVLVAGGKDIDVPEDMIELFYDLNLFGEFILYFINSLISTLYTCIAINYKVRLKSNW